MANIEGGERVPGNPRRLFQGLPVPRLPSATLRMKADYSLHTCKPFFPVGILWSKVKESCKELTLEFKIPENKGKLLCNNNKPTS
jgi:hypothetical protein